MVLNQPVAKMTGFYMIGTSVIKELKQLLPEINSIIDTILIPVLSGTYKKNRLEVR